jgi:hypothetical protein
MSRRRPSFGEQYPGQEKRTRRETRSAPKDTFESYPADPFHSLKTVKKIGSVNQSPRHNVLNENISLTPRQYKILNDYYSYFLETMSLHPLLFNLYDKSIIPVGDVIDLTDPDRREEAVNLIISSIKTPKDYEDFYTILKTTTERNGWLSELVEPGLTKNYISNYPFMNEKGPEDPWKNETSSHTTTIVKTVPSWPSKSLIETVPSLPSKSLYYSKSSDEDDETIMQRRSRQQANQPSTSRANQP